MNMARYFSLFPQQRLVKAVRLALAGGVLVALAACGGGGGSVEEPTPPQGGVKKGVLSVSTCAVGENATTCSVGASASDLENVTSAVIEASGQQLPATSPVTINASLGQLTVVLIGDGQELDKESVAITCAAGLEANGDMCVKPAPAPLRYSVIMGMPSGSVGLPARITGDTCATAKVEEAVNETSYPEVFLNFALYNSMLHTTITPSGLVFGTSQVVAEGGQTMSFHYNPVTNKWTDDDGSLGTAPKYTPFAERDAGWVFNSAADHPDPAIGGWAQNDKLLVYVTRADGNQPLCEDVVNGVRSGLPVALDVSHDDFGTWFGFWHFKKD